MLVRSWCWWIYLFCCANFAAAQQHTIHLKISPVYGSNTLALGEVPFQANDSAGLQIDVLKFYLSDFRFLHDTTIVLEAGDLFHLVDASDPESWNIDIPVTREVIYDHVVFNLGIDSTTNVSGAIGGALDPSNGMYWTWQSGYINFKLEGKSRICSAVNNEFLFHLGGYQSPFNSMQEVTLPCKGRDSIRIYLDVKQFLDPMDLASQHHVMSPGREAVSLSQVVAKAFSTTPP